MPRFLAGPARAEYLFLHDAEAESAGKSRQGAGTSEREGRAMDVQTIDQAYQQLQNQSQGTVQEITALANKLQTVAQTGNQDAREWLLDLKSIALAIQAEQNQVGLLLQAIHGFVANQTAVAQTQPMQPSGPWGQPPAAPAGYPPGYGQQPGYGQPQTGGVGGMLSSFLNSGFGRAIEMGAGFGIGDDLINKIF
jgi:hypothetical protein